MLCWKNQCNYSSQKGGAHQNFIKEHSDLA